MKITSRLLGFKNELKNSTVKENIKITYNGEEIGEVIDLVEDEFGFNVIGNLHNSEIVNIIFKNEKKR